MDGIYRPLPGAEPAAARATDRTVLAALTEDSSKNCTFAGGACARSTWANTDGRQPHALPRRERAARYEPVTGAPLERAEVCERVLPRASTYLARPRVSPQRSCRPTAWPRPPR